MEKINENTYIAQLLKKYRLGQISLTEFEHLQLFCAKHKKYASLLEDFHPENSEFNKLLMDYQDKDNLDFDRIIGLINQKQELKKNSFFTSYVTIAASVLAIFTIGIYLWKQPNAAVAETEKKMSHEIFPASSSAILQNTQGKVLYLNQTNDLNFRKVGLFQVHTFNSLAPLVEEMKLIVPKGGKFAVVLSDGTKVNLNSGSSLSFPSKFIDSERIVVLEGEAYFEVEHDHDKPFKVVSGHQIIQVLGTKFNVKHYPDDNVITTSLYEGKVSVHDKVFNKTVDLIPGEISNLSDEFPIYKYSGNIEKELAWNTGLFIFNKTSFKEVIMEISRWYNLDVKYNDEIPDDKFSGELSRYVDFEVILQFLKSSGINITQEGRTLIVN